MTEQVEESTTGSRLLVALLMYSLYFRASCLKKGSWGQKVPDGKIGTSLSSMGRGTKASGHAVAAVQTLHTWPVHVQWVQCAPDASSLWCVRVRINEGWRCWTVYEGSWHVHRVCLFRRFQCLEILDQSLAFFSFPLPRQSPRTEKIRQSGEKAPLKGQPLCLIKLLVGARDGKLGCNCDLS